MAVLTAISSIVAQHATFTWSGMAQTDIGVGVEAWRYTDRTFQTYLTGSGQFGTSSLFIEGSNNSTTGSDGAWIYLADPQGNNINLNASSGMIEAVLENPRWIRPRAGTGTASLVTFALFASKLE